MMWTHLPLGFEDVAVEHAALPLSGDVAEDLQVLGVVRHVEDPGGGWKNKDGVGEAAATPPRKLGLPGDGVLRHHGGVVVPRPAFSLSQETDGKDFFVCFKGAGVD